MLGHSHRSLNAHQNAAEAYKHETLLATAAPHWSKSMTHCVTAQIDHLKVSGVVLNRVQHGGLRELGESAHHLAARMAHEQESFNVNKYQNPGNYCIKLSI